MTVTGATSSTGARDAAPARLESETLIDLEGVGLAYRDRAALEGVDLRIARGDLVAVLGPNGAGKSSLLRCLAGVARGRVGRIAIGGVPVEEQSREALARLVAVVPQQAVLPFAMRVEEVAALGRIPHEHPLLGSRPDDRAAVVRAIERAGVAHLVGRDARELSLGERQLVLLAMALAQSAPILLLDEPTVHLDLRHQVEVMALLADLNRVDGTTVIAVLHDLTLAAHFFPRVVLLERGRVVADGRPAEVLTPERIRAVYGVDPRDLSLVPRRGGLRPTSERA